MSINKADTRPPSLRRVWLLLPIAAALAAFFVFGLNQYISLKALAEHREWLLAEVERRGVAAPLCFIALYAVMVGASIPGATVLTLVGGFLFGTVLGAASTVVGATIGAAAIFLLARTAIGEAMHARAKGWIKRLEVGLQRDALSYLLFLRLVPLFPFFVVNLVPAFLGVSLRDFVLATAVGIVPATIVYSSVGSGLGEIFASGGKADLHQVASDPKVWLPMVGLGLLALLPVAYKRWRGRGA
jgi:uncharacterized membrane protein YdjX (TVP38/TMEM64 family)